MKTNIKTKGFTIVELLVVIVVIGILAAITMVSYSGVTTKANLSANKANASSVISAADAYFAEYGTYPTKATLSNGSVKVPSSIVIGDTAPTAPSSTATATIGYFSASTGYCVSYWDTVNPGKVTFATAGTGATCL